MDPRPLRNAVEHFAADIAKGDPSEGGHAAAGLFLALGQTFVGIYEELAGIRRALEGSNPEEHSQ